MLLFLWGIYRFSCCLPGKSIGLLQSKILVNSDWVFNSSCILSLRNRGLHVFRTASRVASFTCNSGFEFDLYCSGFTSVENRWEIEHVSDSYCYFEKLLKNGYFFIGNVGRAKIKYISLCSKFWHRSHWEVTRIFSVNVLIFNIFGPIV